VEKELERYQGGGAVEVEAIGDMLVLRNEASVVRIASRD
jgi:hypothetical protein